MPRKDEPGMYDLLLNGKPKYVEEATTQAKIDAIKDTILTRAPRELAQGYVDARRAKDRVDEELKKMALICTAYEQLLAESQERGGDGWGEYGAKDNALRLSSGDLIRIQREPYIYVKDKEAYRLWCIANGYVRDLHMWPSKTAAIGKERLKAGQEEPDGCTIHSKPKVFFTAAK